ncbi:MAG: hypothetical protein EORIYHIE_003445 [Candidatus Fervidibacter sp.]|jgi:hypothetical protein
MRHCRSVPSNHFRRRRRFSVFFRQLVFRPLHPSFHFD